MSETEKISILERVAALPEEDQRNLAFFVAGMAAKATDKDKERDEDDKKKDA